MRITRHNGRAGVNGVYNPKHNDRNFDIAASEHIDEMLAKRNVYYTWLDGLYTPELMDANEEKSRFVECERIAYGKRYTDHIIAQNERNEKTRHTERNRTVDDLLSNKKTCPEETIYQIGDMDESVPYEVLLSITVEFFEELEKRYGEYYHTLDWALHLDESTPHIHERHVFDCENQYGEICPQQEKALEKMGIPLLHPDKKPGRNNNRKMVFDAKCRELLMDICEGHKIEIERDPIYGGRKYREKMDHIIQSQKEKLSKLEVALQEKEDQIEEANSALNDKVEKLSDVEALLDEVADISYKKACEKVAQVATEKAKEETKKAAIDRVIKFKEWRIAPERKGTDKEKSLIKKILEQVEEKLKAIGDGVPAVIKKVLSEPAVAKAAKEEIKDAVRPSLSKRLSEKKDVVADNNQKNHEIQRTNLVTENSKPKKDNQSL